MGSAWRPIVRRAEISIGFLIVSGDLLLLHLLASIFAAAVHHRTGDTREHGLVGEFERVDDFEERRNVLEARLADLAREARYIEQTALVGPAPVRITLEVGVLKMKRTDGPAQAVQPLRHSGVWTVERLVKRVTD